MTKPQTKKAKEPFPERPWVKYFWLPLIVAIIAGIVLLIVPSIRPAVFRAVGKPISWLYHAQVPLLLLLVVLTATVVLYVKLQNERRDPKKYKIVNAMNGLSVPILSPEQRTILKLLGEAAPTNVADFSLYGQIYRQDTNISRLDYNLILDEMKKKDLISEAGYRGSEMLFKIGPLGMEALRADRQRVKAKRRS